MSSIRHGNISFEMPAGWEDITQVLAGGPAEGGFRPNLGIARSPTQGLSLEKIVAGGLSVFKQRIPSVQVVKEGPAQYGTLRGFLRECTFSVEGKKLSCIQFTVVQGANAYVATFTDLSSRIVEGRKQVDQMFKTLSFEGAGRLTSARADASEF
jgi:hypothetical protein